MIIKDKESCDALNWLVRDYREESTKAFYFRTIKVMPDGSGVATDGEWLRILPDCFEHKGEELCYLVERKKGQYFLHIKPESALFKFPSLDVVNRAIKTVPLHDQWYDLSHLVTEVSAFLTIPFRLWMQCDPSAMFTYGILNSCDMVLLKQKDLGGWILLAGEKREGVYDLLKKADELSRGKLSVNVSQELLEPTNQAGVPVPAEAFIADVEARIRSGPKVENPYLSGTYKNNEAQIINVYNPYLEQGAAF